MGGSPVIVGRNATQRRVCCTDPAPTALQQSIRAFQPFLGERSLEAVQRPNQRKAGCQSFAMRDERSAFLQTGGPLASKAQATRQSCEDAWRAARRSSNRKSGTFAMARGPTWSTQNVAGWAKGSTTALMTTTDKTSPMETRIRSARPDKTATLLRLIHVPKNDIQP